jgi:hypothetical protein
MHVHGMLITGGVGARDCQHSESSTDWGILAFNCIRLAIHELGIDVHSGHFPLLIDHKQSSNLTQ